MHRGSRKRAAEAEALPEAMEPSIFKLCTHLVPFAPHRPEHEVEHVSFQTSIGTPLKGSEFLRNRCTYPEGVSGSRLMISVRVRSAQCWSLLHEVAHVSHGMSLTRA